MKTTSRNAYTYSREILAGRVKFLPVFATSDWLGRADDIGLLRRHGLNMELTVPNEGDIIWRDAMEGRTLDRPYVERSGGDGSFGLLSSLL